MAEVNYAAAAKVFNKIEAYLKSQNWKYEKNVEDLSFSYQVRGDDLPITFTLKVDAERSMIRSFSFMPFVFEKDKRLEGAVAVCIANCGMVNGCFKYDVSEGTLFHNLAVYYMDTNVTDEMIRYIIEFGVTMVDQYNDRFFALNKGYIDLKDFIEME